MSRFLPKGRILYGYRTDEFRSLTRLETMNKIRPTLCTIKNIKTRSEKYCLEYRPPVSATLPMYLDGYVGYKPDDSDLASIIDGIKHRVGGVTPSICKRTVAEFKSFVSKLLRLFPRLEPDTDVSPETYIAGLNFPQSRKDQLTRAVQNVEERTKKMNPLDVKSFIKEETYGEPKAFRTINSRIDEYKVQVGPWVHAVEKLIFKMKWFIKTIPVAERAAKVIERLEKQGNVYMSTDFTAFESSFRKEIMEAAEFQLFEHVTKDVPGSEDFVNLYKNIALDNRLLFDAVVASVACKRMSGEMSTSIANGFTNLCLILFTAYKEGLKMEDIELFVEGDDAIISAPKVLTMKWFEKLGFLCKMETHRSVRNASFCGMIFAEPGHSIRDPRPVLAKFGWTMRQYINSKDSVKLALLRAKAMSLACELPNCPILSTFAHRVMDLTRGMRVDKFINKSSNQSFDMHKKAVLLEAMLLKPWQTPPDISSDSRVLMEMMYGIDVPTQLAWESHLSKIEFGPFDLPASSTYFSRDWAMNWEDYVSQLADPWASGVKRNLARIDAYTTYLPGTHPADYRGATGVFHTTPYTAKE